MDEPRKFPHKQVDASGGGAPRGAFSLVDRSALNVLDRLPTPILITDREGEIVYVNPATEALSGYPSSELLGNNPRMLSAGVTPPYVYSDLWSTILSGLTWRGELCNRRKDGALYLESIHIAPVSDAGGGITHFVASWFDVSAFHDLQERLKSERDELRKTTLKDYLTGLYNRRGFYVLAEHYLKTCSRTKERILLIFVDIDNLKGLNDQVGHKGGDAAIRETADILRAAFRSSDVVARIGGDEFAVAAMGAKEPDRETILSHLRSRFDRRNWTMEGKLPRLECSIGALWVDPAESLDLDRWIDQADQLMYEDKKRRHDRPERAGS